MMSGMQTLNRLKLLISGGVLEPVSSQTCAEGLMRFLHVCTGIEFLLVPPGAFRIGSSSRYADSDESPVSEVFISQSFLFARTPCTQSQWRRGCEAIGLRREVSELAEKAQFPVFGEGQEKPIYHVSWLECISWCRANSMDLPTEAEWEYSCRAGIEAEFNFGSLELSAHDQLRANMYYSESGLVEAPDVAQMKPNKWGFHDFHGTVWEWCKDYYAEDFYSKLSRHSSDPVNLVSGGKRVHRGGAWDVPPICCRSSARYRDDEQYCHGSIGFRPVLRI